MLMGDLATALYADPSSDGAVRCMEDSALRIVLGKQAVIPCLRLQALRSGQVITLIMLHDLNTVLRHGDGCVLIKQGRLLGEGLPQDVISAAMLAVGYGVNARLELCSRGMSHVVVDGLRAVPSCGAWFNDALK